MRKAKNKHFVLRVIALLVLLLAALFFGKMFPSEEERPVDEQYSDFRGPSGQPFVQGPWGPPPGSVVSSSTE